jgi:hypothetical protein
MDGEKESEAGGRPKGDGEAVRGNPFPRPLGVQGDIISNKNSRQRMLTAIFVEIRRFELLTPCLQIRVNLVILFCFLSKKY